MTKTEKLKQNVLKRIDAERGQYGRAQAAATNQALQIEKQLEAAREQCAKIAGLIMGLDIARKAFTESVEAVGQPSPGTEHPEGKPRRKT